MEPEKVVEEEEDGIKRRILTRIRRIPPTKFLFTLLQSTVDVRVSAYETTLKKMYQQLMKDIKRYPENVIETLKEKKKKDVLSAVTLSTSVALGSTSDEQEQSRLVTRITTKTTMILPSEILASLLHLCAAENTC